MVINYYINTSLKFTEQWARELGLRCSPPVRIPAYPAEHFYAIACPFPPNSNITLPYIRDFDSHSYMREWQGI